MSIAPSQTPYLNKRSGWRWTRRMVQLASLTLWLALFVLTRQSSDFWLPVDLFVMSDPLVAALTLGAAQIAVASLAWSLVWVALTLVLGRFFCGWLCPLGTLIDAAAHVLRPPELRFSLNTHLRLQRVKYVLLVAMAGAALLSSQWVFLLDPLVLLFRSLTAGLLPLLGGLLPAHSVPEVWRLNYLEVAFAPFALLLLVLGLTAITPRFYCRYLCPLGALYGLLSRAPLLRRRVAGCDACKGINDSKQCVAGCRMQAMPKNSHYTDNHECIRCMSGRSFCHAEAIGFEWRAPWRQKVDRPLELSRRSFVVSAAAGIGLAPMTALSAFHRGEPRNVVRPPRVLDEQTFADQCVRCGMCVQACPTQTLQFTHLEAGLAGLWTPAITPRAGGCIAECKACGQVCPTGAIPAFTTDERDKWSVKMGTAVLEKGRCISYVDGLKCEKCIEICPTKAFIIEAKTNEHPLRPAAVDYVRCVGCGLCEHACRKIVYGRPALLTFAHGQGQPTVLRERPTQSYQVPTR